VSAHEKPGIAIRILRHRQAALTALLATLAAGPALAPPAPDPPATSAPRSLPAGSPPQVVRGDPVHGKSVYQVCMACHSLDEDDVGPRHRGVLGRTAGSVPGYAYSPALKSSGLVWDPETLDRWLTNPQALVPGAKMFFALSNAKDRADVIAYLAEQH
jgi:cytochrome c